MLWKFSFLYSDKVRWLLRWFICEVEVSQLIWQHFYPVHFIINLEGNHFGSRLKIPVSHQNSQTSKEIGADISIFLGSSVLYWHIVKQSSIFVTASIFNLWFLVRMFSKTLIVNYVVFPMQFWQTIPYYLWEILHRNRFE